MNRSWGSFLRHVPSPDGPQADLLIFEPNGDAYEVRCLCRGDGTEIGGNGDELAFLNAKYGPATVCSVARRLTIVG